MRKPSPLAGIGVNFVVAICTYRVYSTFPGGTAMKTFDAGPEGRLVDFGKLFAGTMARKGKGVGSTVPSPRVS